MANLDWGLGGVAAPTKPKSPSGPSAGIGGSISLPSGPAVGIGGSFSSGGPAAGIGGAFGVGGAAGNVGSFFSGNAPSAPAAPISAPSFSRPRDDYEPISSSPPPPPKVEQPSIDPSVLINQMLERLGYGQIDAGLKSARERAIIQFGDPALASMAGFGVDPQAGVFARQNYLSGNADLARIDKANELAKRQIINRLAAHGIIRSGDLGYLEGEQSQAYGNAQYDLRQKFLDYLAGLASQAQEKRNALRQSVINSVLQAYQQYGQNPSIYTSLFGG